MRDMLPSDPEAAVYFVAVLVLCLVCLAFIALAASEGSRADRAEEELRLLTEGEPILTIDIEGGLKGNRITVDEGDLIERLQGLDLRDSSIEITGRWS